MTSRFDVAVVGAGIVGLSTARAIGFARPGLSIVILEKEEEIATHQTGRNSGVVHAGLYYRPGSLKARLCVEGGPRLLEFCDERGIDTTQAGKIVVATSASQLPALAELERRAGANGVRVVRVGPDEICEHEPEARGVEGLRVPFTGAVEFRDVARAFAEDLIRDGAEVRTGHGVLSSRSSSSGRILETVGGPIECSLVVNCAGLHVDRIARLLGTEPGVKVLPFRGEYWSLTPDAAARVRGHIYPVPDPRFPHLGVHFTRDVRGRVEIGPNAVWAWGREAYGRLSGNPRDALETLSYRGFWNLARRHWRTGLGEQWRSMSRAAFVRRARQLVPRLDARDLDQWRSGVRAQAVDTDGALIYDFLILQSPGVVNVINAPSPAATSCLSIGEHIAAIALEQL
ncbi:MAG: L-2-hydroxyglutarate oxidase [Gemmatimonadota bacterium]|nr:L-2-hydroxyglutarate oxidase [Gemmatimonadota bacterium]